MSGGQTAEVSRERVCCRPKTAEWRFIMEDSLALRFLYRTVPGRMILKLLVRPEISRLAGAVLDSGLSRWFVPYYIRKNEIDMSSVEIPAGGFPSFNAFFTRKRAAEDFCPQPGWLFSPCDGFLSFIRIRKNRIFDIKHTKFSLEDLLGDEELAAEFEDGTALVFRLTPVDYHRYGYAASGQVLCHRRIDGVLHCVRPAATRTVPVYAQNSREYEVLRSEEFGKIVQMEIGALMVGKITNLSCQKAPGQRTSDTDFRDKESVLSKSRQRTGDTDFRDRESGLSKSGQEPVNSGRVHAGQEKGYFEFGGSTILLLLPKESVRISRRLYEVRDENGEVPVRRGERVAAVRR